MTIPVSRPVRKLILIMIIVVAIGISIAMLYYNRVNRAADPRTVAAREMYGRYDDYASSGDYRLIFALLDSIEQVYLSTEHYTTAFEPGVVLNNRSAALITIVLSGDKIPGEMNPFSSLGNDSLMILARSYALQAEDIYLKWLQRFRGLDEEAISGEIRGRFLSGLPVRSEKEAERFLSSRVKEIARSVPETDRRLSVCYTNQGLIQRYFDDYKGAAEFYHMALDLWDRNLSAENNLNLLLGKDPVKRNIIQKLFPPPRDE